MTSFNQALSQLITMSFNSSEFRGKKVCTNNYRVFLTAIFLYSIIKVIKFALNFILVNILNHLEILKDLRDIEGIPTTNW